MSRAATGFNPTSDRSFVESWEERKARRERDSGERPPVDLGAVVSRIGKLPELPPMALDHFADAGEMVSPPDHLADAGKPIDTLRSVVAVDLGDAVPQTPPTDKPTVEWMAPSDLLVDAAYQRDLSEKSLKLIRRIVEQWDWRRFKPPVVAWTERGFEIIDGQHTAIAAASHPGIETIPVLMVEAAELQDRASAFIGHNRDRLTVTAVQLHHAAVAAGDEDALTVQQVCERAGVTLLRNAYGSRTYKAGETLAISAIAALVKRRHAKGAREILALLVQAERAPVAANEIKAVELLLTDPQYADEIEPADLVVAIKALGDASEKEAKVFASEHCVPLWRGLASVWFRKCRKRRKA